MKVTFLVFTLICLFVNLPVKSQNKLLGTDTIRLDVTVQQAKTMVDTNFLNPDFIIIDVRTQVEYIGGHIANAINIDYYSSSFGTQLSALDRNKMYLIHCASGGRSPKARDTMIKQHFREIYHMYQGISAWTVAGYPTVTGYTSVAEDHNVQEFVLFPNPAENFIQISWVNISDYDLQIFNINGKLMMNCNVKTEDFTLPVTDLPAGLYFIRFSKNGMNYTRKFTVL